jgi:hypothetical protein
MDAAQIDWDHLRWKFNWLDASLFAVRVPSQDLIEGHRLPELTYGQVESPLADLIEYGHVLHFDDDLTRETVDQMMMAIGRLPKPDGKGGFERVRTPSDVIRDGLAKQVITPEFIEAWGQLSFYAGLTNGLLLRDREAKSDFFRKLNSGLNTTVVQQHWYAHWIAANASNFDKDAWEDENVRLAVLCGEIAAGEVAPWSPYPKEWFSTLLSEDDPTVLRTTLTRLSKPKILTMIKHRDLTPKILPPLCPKEFQRIDDNRP